MIGGGRRALRQVLHQAALVASIRNKDLKLFADRLRKEGKPHKVVAAAVARKLVAVGNAFANPASPGRRKPDDGSRPRRPDAAETLFIAAAEGRHFGRSARADSVERFVVNPRPDPRPGRMRRQGLSTSFPCFPSIEQNPCGSEFRRSRDTVAQST